MSCQIETNPSALTTMCLNPGVQMRIEDSIVMMARQPRSLLRPQLNWLNTKSPIDVKYFGQVLLLVHRVLIWAGSYFEPEPAKKFTCKALKQISELTIPHRWDCMSISQEIFQVNQQLQQLEWLLESSSEEVQRKIVDLQSSLYLGRLCILFRAGPVRPPSPLA